jgi:hypothetical protein
MQAVPRLYVFALQLMGKTQKTSVRLVEECRLGTIQYVDIATGWQVVKSSLLIPVFLL